jgi:hypothetical protein
VFEGTPPPKPLRLDFKNRFAYSGDTMGGAWAHHTGDDSKPVSAKISLSPEDITWMSRYSCSQILRLTLTAIHAFSSAGKNKNPRSRFRKQGWEKVFFESLPAYACSIRINFRLLPKIGHGSTGTGHTAPDQPAMTQRFRGDHRGPTRGKYVRASFHRMRKTYSTRHWFLQQIFHRPCRRRFFRLHSRCQKRRILLPGYCGNQP